MRRWLLWLRSAWFAAAVACGTSLGALGAAAQEPAPAGAEAEAAPPPAKQRVAPQDEWHGFGESLQSARVLPQGLQWDEGLWLRRKPGRFTLRLNFRMDIDYVGVQDDRYVEAGGRVGNTRSGGELRRARLTARGDLGAHTYYKMSVEVTDTTAGLRDFFLDARRFSETGHDLLPNIKMGNFFEPFSLEQQTPSSRLTFLSRSASTLAVGLGRSLGVMAYDDFRDGTVGYALGAFVSPLTSVKDFGDRIVDDTLVRDGYGITGRIWWMPWGNCRGICRRLLVGASFSNRLGMSGIRFRARPECHKFEHVIDTDFSTDVAGTPLLDDASTAYLTGIEVAWQHGALGVQGEYYWSRVKSLAGGNPLFHGGYVETSYWLTGECRTLARGGLQPVHICNPRDPCRKDSGWGGVQLAARLTWVDLVDGNVFGGTMLNATAGVNWHLAERRRLMLNVVRAQVDDGIADQPIWILQTRLQLEF